MTLALVHFNHSFVGNETTWADMRTSAWKPNYGDMLVCAAVLRQVEAADSLRVGFGYEPQRPVRQALIRGSTYLHHSFDFDAANKTLDSLDAPLAIVGLGAQNPTQDIGFLDDCRGARDFVARLSERSVSISARGDFSAAVLERLGAKAVRVTGCPSLFYSLKVPDVAVPEQLRGPERAIGVSIHSGLSANIFCVDPKAARRAHIAAIRYGLRDCRRLSLFEQGVMSEFSVADESLPMAERLAAAQEVITRLEGAGAVSPEDLLAHMVSVRSIEEWLRLAGDLDAIIGFRFHGNMVALLQGKPCFYFVYDSRITEFCRLYHLPMRDVRDGWCDPAERMLTHDWSRANAAFARCFAELRAFYRENGLSTVWDRRT